MTAGAERPFIRWCVLALAALLAACGDDPTSSSPVCTDQVALTVGAPVQATLLSGDHRFQGAYIDHYALRLDTPDSITVRVSSSQIQPLILIFSAAGDVVAQAFQADPPGDGGERAPSLARYFPAGCTLIGVSSYALDETGAYTVEVLATP